MEISEKKQRQLRIEQKLDAILVALGHEISICPRCIDGVRTCGVMSDPEERVCYACKGSAIAIEKKSEQEY